MNDQSETPRTDGAEYAIEHKDLNSGFTFDVVDSDFARKLERENMKLREATERLLNLWHKIGGNPDDKDVQFAEEVIAEIPTS